MDNKKIFRQIEELDVEDVVKVLEKWEMTEFVEFVKDKQLDGRKLLEVTEGIVKLWRPKAHSKKFILFVQELRLNPERYLEFMNKESRVGTKIIDVSSTSIACQYQTVCVKKVKEEHITSTVSGIEELLKRIVPAKSFLYRNQPKTTPYVPMDATTPKKQRKIFRMSSYEYPQFDLRSKFSRNENFNDRGYYSIKTNSRFYIQKTYRKPESRTKYKSMSTAEELNDKLPEDHFYEDLCYSDAEKEAKTENNDLNHVPNVKPCLVKIQELFQSFKLPFFKRTDDGLDEDRDMEVKVKEREGNIYENSDTTANMYDSVHVTKQVNEINKDKKNLAVEDYLEPIQTSKDYCDVTYREKEESLLGYIMSIFENRFGIRRETNDTDRSEEIETVSNRESNAIDLESEKGNDARRPRKTNMADRPLPVPVENEPYYMNIDRSEAENLLCGQPDGTFVLRPSSQPNHAYTLSVACSGAVHNVGVRRRPDGRLALGFARRGERSFASVTSLLRHHKKRRLLLVAAGGVIGATTLNESPHYYQTPNNIPVSV